MELGRRFPFTEEGLRKRYVLGQRMLVLTQQGWSKESMLSAVEKHGDLQDERVGSPLFLTLWESEKRQKSAKQVLQILVNLLGMPEDLSGTLQENQALVARFAPVLAPNHPFWWDLANLVDMAFPGHEMEENTLLARQIHQLRYIISSQQAEYIRRQARHGESDACALARFLKRTYPWPWQKKSYTIGESARLHNKLKFSEGRQLYPSSYVSYNIKILLNFHTEFILDSRGNFLNEVDAREVTEIGVVNGASFNYGKSGSRHWDLDVDTVRPHDPAFRNAATKGYRAPNRSKKGAEDYDRSYFNPTGLYAKDGLSSYGQTRQVVKEFKKLVKSSK